MEQGEHYGAQDSPKEDKTCHVCLLLVTAAAAVASAAPDEGFFLPRRFSSAPFHQGGTSQHLTSNQQRSFSGTTPVFSPFSRRPTSIFSQTSSSSSSRVVPGVLSNSVHLTSPISPSAFRRTSSAARPAVPVLTNFHADSDEDGVFSIEIDEGDGIRRQESSSFTRSGARSVKGVISFRLPDGTPFQMRFLADENGFQPRGNVIPTTPKTPPHLLAPLTRAAQLARRRHSFEDDNDFDDLFDFDDHDDDDDDDDLFDDRSRERFFFRRNHG